MATIAELVQRKTLVPITLNLRARELQQRRLFGFPQFMNWSKEVLPRLEPVDSGQLPPFDQTVIMLRNFFIGKPMDSDRRLKKLTPLGNDVWELKSIDVRIFSWFPEKDTFICCSADSMENLKKKNPPYKSHIDLVVVARDDLDLDEPKAISGDNVSDVTSF